VTGGGDGDGAGGGGAGGAGDKAGGVPAAPSRTMEPPVGPDSAPFWDATRDQRLLIQWCTACDRGIFYPRSFCPFCGTSATSGSSGSTLEWRAASGRATVHAATVEHRPAATGATFSDGRPYVVALVDLEEGVRMMTNVVGCPPEDVVIGMAVSVTWEPLSDGRHLPLFTPLDGTP
jgi:uncharacterized OB-fold protein